MTPYHNIIHGMHTPRVEYDTLESSRGGPAAPHGEISCQAQSILVASNPHRPIPWVVDVVPVDTAPHPPPLHPTYTFPVPK